METLEVTAAADAAGKPGYKHTRFGWIPEDWDVQKLGEVAEIHNHLRFPLSEEVRKGMQGPYPYYGPTKIQDYLDHFRVEGKYVLIGEDGDHFLKFQTQPMTLLVDGQYNVNNHAHLIKGAEGCETEWLYWFFNSRDLSNDITRQGAGRYKLTKDALKRLLLVVPPVAEQQAIIAVLNALANQAKAISELIKTKRTYKRGLMQQLLTGQRRFPEFQGQQLQTAPIGTMITESREPLRISNPHERISVRLNLKGVEARDVRGTEAEEATVYYRRRAGQFIYGKQNLHKGAMGIIPSELDGFSSTQDIPTFDFAPGIDPKWFFYLMSREDFYPSLEKIATGTGSKRIQPASLYKIQVPFPTLPEQQRIAAVLTACDQEIELLQAQLEQWQQQKKGLMQQLLTGQLRVPC